MTNPDPALTTHHQADFAVFLATLAPGEQVSTNTVRSRWLPAAQMNPRRLGGGGRSRKRVVRRGWLDGGAA